MGAASPDLAGVLGALVGIVAKGGVDHAGSPGAGAALPLGIQAHAPLLGLGIVQAPLFLVANIHGAGIIVGAGQGRTGTFEVRSGAHGDTLIVLSAAVPVVALHSLLLPLHRAGVLILRGILVAPGLLAGILGDALVGHPRLADALGIALIGEGAWIGVLAGVTGGVDILFRALSGGGVTKGVGAVSGIRVIAHDWFPHADAGHTDIEVGACRAVLAGGAVGHGLGGALPGFTMAGVGGAGVAVVALLGLPGAVSLVVTLVAHGAGILIVAGGAGLVALEHTFAPVALKPGTGVLVLALEMNRTLGVLPRAVTLTGITGQGIAGRADRGAGAPEGESDQGKCPGGEKAPVPQR